MLYLPPSEPPLRSDSPNDRKVADHDHVTGYYFGAAHDECNRKRRVVYDIPVFFHNFRGYDSHLIVTALSNAQYRTRGIEVIGQNMERYMQVKWGKNIVFRDSFMFLTSSLESLVQSLRKTDERKFTHLESLMTTRYPNADFKLLLRKGVFPYEYLSSFDKFNDARAATRETFSAGFEVKSARKRTMTTRSACGQPSDARHSRIILSFILRATCVSWPMCSRTFGACAVKTTSSTRPTLFQRRNLHGTQCYKCKTLSSS